jgi:hypothetical protein
LKQLHRKLSAAAEEASKEFICYLKSEAPEKSKAVYVS